MGCEANGFCGSLSKAARETLCAKCQRQLLGSGSIENYVDTRKHALIVLDGLITGIGYGDADMRNWPDVKFSRYLAITPGYLMGCRELSDKKQDIMFSSSYLRCETTCCIARFDQAFITEAMASFPEIRSAASESLFEWGVVMSELLSIALQPSAHSRVEKIIALLAKCRLYLPESRLAEMLGCSRASVTRAFARMEWDNPRLLDAYRKNKGRAITLQSPERSS